MRPLPPPKPSKSSMLKKPVVFQDEGADGSEVWPRPKKVVRIVIWKTNTFYVREYGVTQKKTKNNNDLWSSSLATKISWMCMTFTTTIYHQIFILLDYGSQMAARHFYGLCGPFVFVRTYQADQVRGPVTPFNWCIIYKTISSSFLNKKWSVLRKDCCTKKLFFQDFF